MVTNNQKHAPIDSELIGHLRKRTSEKQLNFFSPFNAITTDAVQVGYMMSEILNQFEDDVNYHSFFCNSVIEGFHGAIKLARHYLYSEFKNYDGSVFIFDSSGRYKRDFSSNQFMEVLPGIIFFSSYSMFSGIAVRRPTIRIFSFKSLLELEEFNFDKWANNQDSINILDLSFTKKIRLKDKDMLLRFFDIVIWGESLTNHMFPFGAFSTKPKLYKVWHNIGNCGLHSSTYGGNSMVLSFIKNRLLGQYPIFKTSNKHVSKLDQIERSRKIKLKFIFKYLNGYTLLPLYLINPKLNFISAKGSYLSTANNSKDNILDCVGSSGCNAIGHNNDIFLERVIRSYDSNQVYSEILRQLIQKHTGLERTIQGVSGASVVEIAIRLALLAQPQRNHILIIRGNFSGKTLLAMSVTDGVKHMFNPIYKNLTIFDANQKNAKETLLDVLSEQNVGLVWMEYIQGRSFQTMGDELLDVILRNRERHKYFIGIDEILNGGFRTGRLTSYRDDINPEIITFSKAFSGMIIPNAFVAISDKIYTACSKRDLDYTNELAQKYRSEFRACVTLEYFKWTEELAIQNNVNKNSDMIIEKWKSIQGKVHYLKKMEIKGLHINMEVNNHLFPYNIMKSSMRNDVVSYLFYKRASIFCIYTRLLPPLNINLQEANFLIKGIEKAFSTNAIYVLLVFLRMKLLKRWYFFKYG